MSKSVSIRLPEELAAELTELAKESERSRSFLIQKAIEAYLEAQADLQISMDRLNDPTDPIVSVDEMRSEIGL